MNNRNYEIKVRLTQAEMVHLNRLVNGSKLAREAYLRQLISGVVPQDAVDFMFKWASPPLLRRIHRSRF